MECVIDRELMITVIDEYADILRDLSLSLWGKPETSFKEIFAHKLITEFLENQGFSVEKHYVCPTGFKAELLIANNDKDNDESIVLNEITDSNGTAGIGKTIHNVNDLKISDDESSSSENSVCLICEYDALPELGHATGHNLGTVASLAAALALKAHMNKYSIAGKVTVLGTPGEDGGSGKIDMINAGVFDDITFCMLPTPMHLNIVCPVNSSLLIVTVRYEGKSAHASASPWEGKNALDAAVACYTNISLLRQQLKPTWTVNGIISKGGVQANIIPDLAELQFYLRAPDEKELVILQQKVAACFHAAAKATGCELHYDFRDKPVYSLWHNPILADAYAGIGLEFGMEFTDDLDSLIYQCGSSDMGNVSHLVPCLCPAFDILTNASRNTTEFQVAAGTQEAHEKSMTVAKVLATTATQVMTNLELRKQMMETFKQQKIASRQPRNKLTSSSLSDIRISLSRGRAGSDKSATGTHVSSMTDLSS
ncbi:peptidase M20 domain-containing protein 2-like [Tubulanus polymorphus]|uniref:peptidase M20 domain-containing protein 2-like n=1 Tax=Tubulanus polymorphus TaxID=672921 RepID=UPI003DA5C90F